MVFDSSEPSEIILEFDADDWVFLKVSPSVMKFGRKGKLIPRYSGSYRIFRRIGRIAYEMELPPESEEVQLIMFLCYESVSNQHV